MCYDQYTTQPAAQTHSQTDHARFGFSGAVPGHKRPADATEATRNPVKQVPADGVKAASESAGNGMVSGVPDLDVGIKDSVDSARSIKESSPKTEIKCAAGDLSN
ncbi:hypothetical protein HK104_003693 [Borealophlyctis nickersoniae]|nr:hypothetical protein HK104_003693 [Borealophlyctis nickersoniae]